MSPNASVRVPNGSTVNVTLSLGKISVSDFTGKTLSQLNAWVSEQNKLGANLKVTSTQDYSTTTASGQLISQSPSSGDINPGTTIKASVSKGEGVVVATYKGTTNTNVQEGLKLNKVEVYSNSASGTVLEQSISAGTKVDSGTSITLTVSIGKPTVNSFAGQSLSNLQAHINSLNSNGANLSLSKGGEEYNTSVGKGNIISNSTGSVSVGSSISYTISKGTSVQVENYVGRTQPSVSGIYFNLVGSEYHDTYAEGVIIWQSRQPGTYDSGITVDIKKSLGQRVGFSLYYFTDLNQFDNQKIQSEIDSKCSSMKLNCVKDFSIYQDGSTGKVLKTQPAGGSTVYEGDTVVIYIGK